VTISKDNGSYKVVVQIEDQTVTFHCSTQSAANTLDRLGELNARLISSGQQVTFGECASAISALENAGRDHNDFIYRRFVAKRGQLKSAPTW
jgi:hypothetical protein